MYNIEENGFNIEISASLFSTETIKTAEKLIQKYPSKVSELSLFCKESECFKMCFSNETVETIAKKLHKPIIKIDELGGILT